MAGTKPKGRTLPAASDLHDLDRQLRRHRARAGRLWRAYRATDDAPNPTESTNAHQAWSDTIDAALVIADAISRQQPRNVAELVVQLEAVWWWIDLDDSVLDGSARRWLHRFRRSLRRLVNAQLK